MLELLKSLLSLFSSIFQRKTSDNEGFEQKAPDGTNSEMTSKDTDTDFESIVPEKMMRTLIRKGATGVEVQYLQWQLGIDQSGTFDDLTEAAVIQFQKEEDLTDDGIVGKITWQALLDLLPLREETEISTIPIESEHQWDDSKLARTWSKYGGLLTALSERLEIPSSSLLAVLMVESYGEPFGTDGRPIIRFENHIFHDKWGRKNTQVFDQHYRFATEPGDKRWHNHWFREQEGDDWIHMHQATSDSQEIEWRAFNFARTLDNDAAINAASFGLGQIIGFNASQAGYEDLSEFVEDMNDIRFQILAMTEFIRNGKEMLDGLWEGDFVKFAREYNGPGQPDYYGSRIAQFAEEASKHI